MHLKCKTSSLTELSNFNNSTIYNPDISNPSESLNIFNNSKLTSLNYKVIENTENNSIKCSINEVNKSKTAEIPEENINMKNYLKIK